MTHHAFLFSAARRHPRDVHGEHYARTCLVFLPLRFWPILSVRVHSDVRACLKQEVLVDKLKLLDYEKEFCRRK